MVAFILSLTLSAIIFFPHTALAKTYGAKLCDLPQYECYAVKRGDSWQKLFPDEDQRDIVMRINRMNTKLYPGLKIAVPTSFGSDPLDYSPFPQYIDPPGTKFILVSLSKLAFGAYDSNGTLQRWGPVSGGQNYCADVRRGCRTPAGKFAIYQKRGAGCVSSKFPLGKGGAPMPYCMFFHRGFALHGSYTVPGYHDSHGCVRLFVNDAKWLNQEFANGSRVTVIINK
ncbi:L,D-transpeptidase [Aquicella lusitana]|uniref:Lipoprotein-anchoring transpeptidase ErfK/SrfK n=1 Tax=Aquicella lusitana TaxID=254246 RepID=A0A370GML9_9COXI|nr:L,D-transpeptidase [Aquicella lusitana]RDI44529.1 lipoprotein-anchoring transpeptidase ErfK/SrfK [Aquicella lusitana]VVC72529.1 hypothetical protein AQULUS_02410 [Aquicella lusitana]